MSQENTLPTPPTGSPQRRHAGFLVVAGILLISTIMGVLSFRSYLASEKYLIEARENMAQEGSRLTSDQCVDAVLQWAPQCSAMKSLCDASVPRMMHSCLAARDRRADCMNLGASSRDTHFEYRQCQARGVDKKMRKTCGNTYQALVAHCERLGVTHSSF